MIGARLLGAPLVLTETGRTMRQSEGAVAVWPTACRTFRCDCSERLKKWRRRGGVNEHVGWWRTRGVVRELRWVVDYELERGFTDVGTSHLPQWAAHPNAGVVGSWIPRRRRLVWWWIPLTRWRALRCP